MSDSQASLGQRIYTILKTPKGRGRPLKVNPLLPFEKCRSVDDIAELLNGLSTSKVDDLKAFVQKREQTGAEKKSSSGSVKPRKRALSDDEDGGDEDDSPGGPHPRGDDSEDSEAIEDADQVIGHGEEGADGDTVGGEGGEAAGADQPKRKKRKIKDKSKSKTKVKAKSKRRSVAVFVDDDDGDRFEDKIRRAIADGIQDAVRALASPGGILHDLVEALSGL